VTSLTWFYVAAGGWALAAGIAVLSRGAQPWLRVFQLPSYAPDLNPVEGIWSSLKRGPLANVAFTSFAHLLQVIRYGLRKIQYQPGLIDGCLAGTGLSLEPDEL